MKDRPQVPEALVLAKRYYLKPENLAGGSLHIVLDEGNVHTADVMYCLEKCYEKKDFDGLAIACLLLKMTKTQRLKVGRSI
jgi:hypothetical protein